MYRPNKTKIVATVGPASSTQPVLERMIRAGMDVARLNFSHGDFESHRETIGTLRAAAQAVGRRVAIMADLPGPKLRVGEIEGDAIELVDDASFALTTEEILGSLEQVSVSCEHLHEVVAAGDTLFLNDGFIELKAKEIDGLCVHCRVVVGGELRSRKGLNLPGIDLKRSAFTPRDRECLEFALAHGVDAVSQSFVSSADDIASLRQAASDVGHRPFVIAKIERAGALERLDSILAAADGIMVARGDLGVEIPIEQIAIAQKRIVRAANRLGKPVITATHMLESMIDHRRPTRAEATDVANAILDGTDCIMLSGESAMGRFPVQAVEMLARIAAVAETNRPTSRAPVQQRRRLEDQDPVNTVDLIALSVERTLQNLVPDAVMVPTDTGATARNITRFRLPVWITALSDQEETCQNLQFSYGVQGVHVAQKPTDWRIYSRDWLRERGIAEGLALLTVGPSPGDAIGSHRMELVYLTDP